MAAHPLHAWTHAQLAQVADAVRPSWALWLQDWGLRGAGPVRCRPTDAADGASTWQAAGERGAQRAWLSAGAQAALAAALFGVRPNARAAGARAAAAAALSDLRGALALALRVLPANAPAQDDAPPAGPWAGSLTIELPLADARLLLAVNAACVAALAPSNAARGPAQAALVPPEQAMAAQAVTLRVELGACELDIGTLQGLRIGDVLPLPHALDAPARVLAPGGRHVCDAYLGRQGGRKAAELACSKP